MTAEPIWPSSAEISVASARALARFSCSAPVRALAGATVEADHARQDRYGQQGSQRQTTYRVAVVQYASSRGEQRTLASGPGRAGVRLGEAGQGRNLALSKARLKRRIRRIGADVPDSEAEVLEFFMPLRQDEVDGLGMIRQSFVTLDVMSKVRDAPAGGEASRDIEGRCP